MSFDIDRIRANFPALAILDGQKARVYLDNPAGTQVAQGVIDRMTDYLVRWNANCDGPFSTSRQTDQLLESTHQAMADLLHAPSSREIVFGQNMTSLTFALSRALGHRLKPGDEIVVTRMDHDANIRPWVRLAEDTGAIIRWLDFDTETARLRMDQLDEILNERTKIVAVGLASNLLGTVNPISEIAKKVHRFEALLFVDAVHYAPHGVIDVNQLGADFLVCSPYKFFGPHQGVLWGKAELLETLPAYRVKPAGETLPGKFETGTQNHEGQLGVLGAIDYLEWLGREFGGENDTDVLRTYSLRLAMEAINRYERLLSRELIAGLSEIDRVTIWGITDPNDLEERVPTVSFTVDGMSPRWIAEMLAAENIFVWDGHSYAVEVIDRLGLSEDGGVVRVGAAHYNTPSEIEQLVSALGRIVHRN
ncbi:cysteine desulfurase-like protein [bacterium]|nr:cysteine desulfurase-like protein [bacterium]